MGWNSLIHVIPGQWNKKQWIFFLGYLWDMPDIFPSPAQRAGATVRVACMQSQRLPQRSWIHWRRRDDECKVYVMENTLTMDENWGHPSILFKEASICIGFCRYRLQFLLMHMQVMFWSSTYLADFDPHSAETPPLGPRTNGSSWRCGKWKLTTRIARFVPRVLDLDLGLGGSSGT